MRPIGRDETGQLLIAGRPWWSVVPAHARLGKIRRRLFEAVGSPRYSHPAAHELDRKLERHLPGEGGVFVEAGAHDGFAMSNTYYFERFKGWRGVLVEPIPELYRRCVEERKHAQVFNCALVGPDHAGETITMRHGGLLSLVAGAQGSDETDLAHARTGAADTYEVDVPARTLSSVLDEAGVGEIDLLSLDVEGYEPEALSGLDLDRHAPRYVLVEMLDPVRTRDRIEELLADRYELAEEVSPRDVLYRRHEHGSGGEAHTERHARQPADDP
jgi:FkbM family methyltransferase